MARATRVRLRTYQAGFGDCALLSVQYGRTLPDDRRERHLLIDFGSMAAATGGPSLEQLAALIAEHCHGSLDVVVATHAHREHVSGFGAGANIDVFRALQPSLVIQPWLARPDPTSVDPRVTRPDQPLVERLSAAQRHASAVASLAFDSERAARSGARLATRNLPDERARGLLHAWASDARWELVGAGDTVRLEDEIPDATIRVLGPPRAHRIGGLSRFAGRAEATWLQAAPGDAPLAELQAPSVVALESARQVLAEPGGAGAAAWLIRQLDERPITQGLDIVEAVDDVVSNSSLILLVTIGSRSFLFGGDAQRVGWSATLDELSADTSRAAHKALRERLRNVEVYKVGGHGTRSATPAALLRLWAQRPADQQLVSVVSTKRSEFAGPTDGAIPHEPLLAVLRTLGPVQDTDRLAPGVWWIDLDADARGTARYAVTEGPAPPAG